MGCATGVNTLTLNATVTVLGKSAPIKACTLTVGISRPQLNYEIQWRTGVSLYQQSSGYSYTINFGTLSPMSKNQGINWSFDTPNAVGMLGVIQILTSGNYVYRTSWLGGTIYSTLGPGTGATFPLLDADSTDTNPWMANYYTGATVDNPVSAFDSPGTPTIPGSGWWFPATWAQMSLNMTDYVMFDDGGMWVPLASFTWKVNAVASLGSPPSISNINAPNGQATPLVTAPTLNSTWPTWTCCTGDYTEFQ